MIIRKNNITLIIVSILLVTGGALSAASKDVLFESFEGSFKKWKVTGEAFDSTAYTADEGEQYALGEGVKGKKFINSYIANEADSPTGTMLSKKFKISHKYMVFYMGGGAQEELGCRVLIGKKAIASKSPAEKGNLLKPYYLDVSKYRGKKAQIEIFDEATSSWGQISFDHIIFTDNYKKYVK